MVFTCDREIELTRQNPELMALLDDRGRSTKTVSAAEAKLDLTDFHSHERNSLLS